MNDAATVSVVIVSRDRPDALRRCLLAVAQLRFHRYEVVVVTDAASRAALKGLPQLAHVKLVAFDEANISAARNLGITAAAGDVVAFLDDDAVPEPTWLAYLIAAFDRPEVVAAGGFVRGRNGITWQSQARFVDRLGRTRPIDVESDRVTVIRPATDSAIKTEGTNMAVRRSVLAEMGGFDPRYRFFLDETDLNLRLTARDGLTAIVPRAEVHHGFAESSRRRSDRAPTDLFEIGASWAVFLHTHAAQKDIAAAWAQIRCEERNRALRHMVLGSLEPRDVGRLMRSLDAGFAEGKLRRPQPLRHLPEPATAFRPFPGDSAAASVLLAGRSWSRRRLRRHALRAVAAGAIVTVLRLSPTALYHRVAFTDNGYWEQTGGIFGKSERTQGLFSAWSFAARVRFETERVRQVRGLEAPACPNAHMA